MMSMMGRRGFEPQNVHSSISTFSECYQQGEQQSTAVSNTTKRETNCLFTHYSSLIHFDPSALHKRLIL